MKRQDPNNNRNFTMNFFLLGHALSNRVFFTGPSLKVLSMVPPNSCVKSVSEHIRSLSGVKHTTTKKSRKADRKAGGWEVNAYGQPCRKMCFFFVEKNNNKNNKISFYCPGDIRDHLL